MKLLNRLRPLAQLILFFFIVASLPKTAFAWGDKAHSVIALIATERLSQSARQEIGELLGKGESLESVSGWADTIRLRRRETMNWHHVEIPLLRSHYIPSEDCPDGCVIQAVDQQVRILRDRNASAAERAEALKFVVHLLGDLHQPFRVTTNNKPDDEGATKVKVVLTDGRATNLRAFWDDHLINEALGDSTLEAYAAQLGSRLRSRSQSSLASTEGSFTEWAIEAHRIAWVGYVPSEQGYFMISDGKPWSLEGYYYQKNRPLMETQLLRAGVRLAKTLNETFGAKAAY